MPAVIAEIETLVHDSLIRRAGVQLQRLTRRDSTRPERDVAEGLRLLGRIVPKIGLPGKLILCKRKGLREVLFS